MQLLSDRARANRKHTGNARGAAETNMHGGPFLRGHTLIIPSDWYSRAAGDQWHKWGFRYDGDGAWVRDIRRPLPGYRAPHKPDVWLESARRAYDGFFPGVRTQED